MIQSFSKSPSFHRHPTPHFKHDHRGQPRKSRHFLSSLTRLTFPHRVQDDSDHPHQTIQKEREGQDRMREGNGNGRQTGEKERSQDVRPIRMIYHTVARHILGAVKSFTTSLHARSTPGSRSRGNLPEYHDEPWFSHGIHIRI